MRVSALHIFVILLSVAACARKPQTSTDNRRNAGTLVCDPGSEVDPHDNTRCRPQGFFECRNLAVPDDKTGNDVCAAASETCVMVTAQSGTRNIHCETTASAGLPATYGAYQARCCGTPYTSMDFATEFLSLPANENGAAVCYGRGKVALSVVSGSGFRSLYPTTTVNQYDPNNSYGGWAVRCGKFSDRGAKQSLEIVAAGKTGDAACAVVGMKCLNVVTDNFSIFYYCGTTISASSPGVAKANCIAPD